jgi:hypothetical protein
MVAAAVVLMLVTWLSLALQGTLSLRKCAMAALALLVQVATVLVLAVAAAAVEGCV